MSTLTSDKVGIDLFEYFEPWCHNFYALLLVSIVHSIKYFLNEMIYMSSLSQVLCMWHQVFKNSTKGKGEITESYFY